MDLGRTTARRIIWGLAGVTLLAPAVAMRVTPDVKWGPGDFVAAAALLAATALALDLVALRAPSARGRVLLALAILVALLLVWAQLALGIVGPGAGLEPVSYPPPYPALAK